ncbi:hypothetical protein TraAM80_04499 [Trypanosoma rangeli]|uniref:Uncharacterized protein n=1 Tax=Trypanosoma rangeli TaxID=5698 RepID=A0A422NJ98_TRYRA|nr:uncharacterized protein TraAM80_04499 [Trypanosoma rangeli]RNF05560.1 hypothetical protein TraAM80_04499 [Trypanosoma rangeli]|eukprot:RNF05560.1 hypothetical protein TraAM80_04499 [Trypanosoma rangeli]
MREAPPPPPPPPSAPATTATHTAAVSASTRLTKTQKQVQQQQQQQRPLLRSATQRLAFGALPSHAGDVHSAADKHGVRSRTAPLRARLPPATPERAKKGHGAVAHSSAMKRQRPQVLATSGFRKSATAPWSSPGGREPQRPQHTCRRTVSLTYTRGASLLHVNVEPGKKKSHPQKQQGPPCTPQRQVNAALLRQTTSTMGTVTAFSPASKKAAILARPDARTTRTPNKKKAPRETKAGAMDLLRRPPSLNPTPHEAPNAPRVNMTSLQRWCACSTSASAHATTAAQQCKRSAAVKALPTPTQKPRVALRTPSAPCFPQSPRRLQRTHTTYFPMGIRRHAAASSPYTVDGKTPQRSGEKTAPQERGPRTKTATSGVGGRGGAAQEGRKRTSTPPLTRTPTALHSGASAFSAFDLRGNGTVRRTSLFISRASGEEVQAQRQRRTQNGAEGGRCVVGNGGVSQRNPALGKAALPIRPTNSTLCREASTRAKKRQEIRQEHERLAAVVPHLSQDVWLAMRRELRRLVEVRSKRTGTAVGGRAVAPQAQSAHALQAPQSGTEEDRGQSIRKSSVGDSRAMPARRSTRSSVAKESPKCLEGMTESYKDAHQEGMCNMGARQRVLEGRFSSQYRGPRRVGVEAAMPWPQLVASGNGGVHSLPRHCYQSPTAVDADAAEGEDNETPMPAQTVVRLGRRAEVDDENKQRSMTRDNDSRGRSFSPSIRPPSEFFDDAAATSADSTPRLIHGSITASDLDTSPVVVPPMRRKSPSFVLRRPNRRKAKAPVLHFCGRRSTPRVFPSATPPRRRHCEGWGRSGSQLFCASRRAGSWHVRRGRSTRGDGVVVLSSDMLVALYATIDGTADGNGGSSSSLAGHCAQRRGRRGLQNVPTARTLSYEGVIATTTTTTAAASLPPGRKLCG